MDTSAPTARVTAVRAAALGAAALAATMALGDASAMETSRDMAGAILVEDAWSRALPPVARNGAAYMVIRNEGRGTDRVVGAEAEIAERVELHTHEMDGELMKMRRLEGGIELPPGSSRSLAPGGLHVMLMGLVEPLEAGKTFDIILRFAQSPPIAVEVTVRDAGGAGHGTHGSMSHSDARGMHEGSMGTPGATRGHGEQSQ